MGFVKHVLAALGTFAVLSLAIGVALLVRTLGGYGERIPVEVPILGGRPIYIAFILSGLFLVGIMVYIMTRSDSSNKALMRVPGGNLQITDPKVRDLVSHYDPRYGMFGAWVRRAHGEQRVKLLQVLNEEQMLLIQRAAMIEKAVIEGQKSQLEFEKFVAENAVQLLQVRVQEELIKDALLRGYTLETDQALKREAGFARIRVDEQRATTQMRLDEEQILSDVRINEEERRSKIKVEEQRKIKEIEHTFEVMKADLAREMAKVKMMPDLVKMNELHRQLSEIHREIEQAERIENITRREAEQQRLQKQADYLHRQIDQLAEKGQGFKYSDGRRN
jgi:hypothetical protein